MQNDQKTGKNDTNSETKNGLTGVTAEDLIRDQTLGIDFKNIKPYTPGGDYGTQRAKGALKAILNDHDVAFALKQPGNKLSFATLQALMNQHNQGYMPSINGESISDFSNIINAVNILLGNNNEGAAKDAITAFFNTHGGSVSADDGLAWVNS